MPQHLNLVFLPSCSNCLITSNSPSTNALNLCETPLQECLKSGGHAMPGHFKFSFCMTTEGSRFPHCHRLQKVGFSLGDELVHTLTQLQKVSFFLGWQLVHHYWVTPYPTEGQKSAGSRFSHCHGLQKVRRQGTPHLVSV